MNSPYYQNFLGIRTETDADGHAYCTFLPGTTAIGREGVMHGGAVASLLEAAGFACLRAALDQREADGSPPLTLEVVSTTVDYLRPGLSIESFAQARIVKIGGRSASLLVEAWNVDRSKPVASANMTLLIRPREG
jgi:uncharacterized protein (TIGR00369 family)